MPTYAKGSIVSPDRTREELNKILKKYGAKGFGFWDKEEHAIVAFELRERKYRFVISFEEIARFRLSPAGKLRTKIQQKTAHEQHIRERWRAILAVVKGKLIAVDASIETFEEAFLRYLVMPGTNQTIGEVIEPQLEEAYRSGVLPPMLQAGN